MLTELTRRVNFRILSLFIIPAFLGSCSATSNGSKASEPIRSAYNFASWILQFGDTTKAFASADHSNGDSSGFIDTDSVGNIYFCGDTYGSMGETNGGNGDVVVGKLNLDGELQWIFQLGADSESNLSQVISTSSLDSCRGIAIDSSDNIYVIGYTIGSLAEPNAGSRDFFLMKLSPLGELLLLKQFGTTSESASSLSLDASGDEMCLSLAIDSEDNLYCAGLTAGNFAETEGGSNDAFVMKLNALGEIQWVRQIGAVTEAASAQVLDASASSSCAGIQVDKNGNVYCVGSVTGNFAELGGGGSVFDIFVLKLDSQGEILWLKQLGSDTATASPLIVDVSSNDYVKGLALDSGGNLYITGYTLSNLGEAKGGAGDGFVLSMDPEGNIRWITQLGMATAASSGLFNASFFDQCSGIAVDNSSDSIYLACDVGGDMFEPAHADGWGCDPFAVKLNLDGDLLWGKQLGSETIPNSGFLCGSLNGVTVDTNGSPVFVGQSYGAMVEGDGGNENGDIFIMKLKPDGTLDIGD